MSYFDTVPPQKWILKGIIGLFVLAVGFHFIYDLTGQNMVAGIFSPVNESTWEHCKVILWPTILWWTIYYFVKRHTYRIDAAKWFTSQFISLVVAILAVPVMYYFYTGAFGIENMAIDIFIVFLAFLVGQYVGYRNYKYGKGIHEMIALFLIAVIVILFIWFTFKPIHIPLFQDPTTGLYGIS